MVNLCLFIMITIIGAFFWIVALAALVRLLLISGGEKFRWLEFFLLFLLALPLFFRPHEDIFGGEDPGSYINSGITYHRQKQFFYIDELLAKVPPEVRPCFYYGHAGFGTTKDACLWIRNADLGMVGPHFQPAYPLMIALAVKAGHEPWALFVVPLFAIFTAFALRALALRVFPHRWAGMLAFLFYTFNPLTIWHARCARPEIIASFFFFGGLALVIYALQNQRWQKRFDLFLGAVCIGISPLLHVTAWLLVIPAGLAALLVILEGRYDFLLYGLISILTAAMFYAETIHLTDYYALRRFLGIIFTPPLLLTAAFILLAAVSILIHKLRKKWNKEQAEQSSSAILSVILSLTLMAVVAALVFSRQVFGEILVLGRPLKHYFYVTDFRVVSNMVSLPLMILSLGGLLAWLVGPRQYRPYRAAICLILLPAVFLAGNIHDFMMTRYLMLAFLPCMALLITALVASLTPRAGPEMVILIAVIICGIGFNKRTLLATTTEHRGFCEYLRPYAEFIKTSKGLLLCEYSRIAAPLEHFFGVPALGLDNERKNDYGQAEEAWAGIMKSTPERPAFFITPYHNPRSAFFDFGPIFSNTFLDCRLEQARQSLPTKVGHATLSLSLFRMKLKSAGLPSTNLLSSPLIINPDAGNMGLRNFANVRQEAAGKKESEPPSGIFDAIPSLPEKIRERAASLMRLPAQGVIQARWTRKCSGILLPVPKQGPALLMILLRAPDPEKSGFVCVHLKWRGQNLGEPRKITSHKWIWQIWELPLAVDVQEDAAWLEIYTTPVWNPKKPNFPEDLGVLVGRIVCLTVDK
jgi:hypothetical protein